MFAAIVAPYVLMFWFDAMKVRYAFITAAVVFFIAYCLVEVPNCRVAASEERQRGMTPNNALERTVKHRGPRLAAAWSSWPAAQLVVRAKACRLTHRRHVYTLRLCGFPGMKGSVVST